MPFPPSRFMCLFNVAEDGSSGRGEGRRFLSGRGRMTVPLPESRVCLPRLQQVDFLSPSPNPSHAHPLSLSLPHLLSSPFHFIFISRPPPSPSLPPSSFSPPFLSLSPCECLSILKACRLEWSAVGVPHRSLPPENQITAFTYQSLQIFTSHALTDPDAPREKRNTPSGLFFHTMKTHENKPDYYHYSKSSTSH